MSAFRALKPICVPLMALPRLAPGPSSSRALELLQRLHKALKEVQHPEQAFTPSLLGYVVFPLTHLLGRNSPVGQDTQSQGTITGMPDRVLECLLDCLTFLVQRWTSTSQGMDVKLWDQLWTFAALILGGPISVGPQASSQPPPSRSEETLVACVDLLEALLRGVYSGGLGAANDTLRIDAAKDTRRLHPTNAMVDSVFPTSLQQTGTRSLLPLLFHTISSFIALIHPSSTALVSQTAQTRALVALDGIITTWFCQPDRARVLASIMPGLISALVKLVVGPSATSSGPEERPGTRAWQSGWNEWADTTTGGVATTLTSAQRGQAGRKQKSNPSISSTTASASLTLLVHTLVLTLSDSVLEHPSVAGDGAALPRDAHGLEDLMRCVSVVDTDADAVDDTEVDLDPETTVIGSPSARSAGSFSTTATLISRVPSSAVENVPFPRLTASYLAFTRTQVSYALTALLPPLTTHHSAVVRVQVVRACHELLDSCFRSLSTGEAGRDSGVVELLVVTLLRLAFPPAEPLPSVYMAARWAVRNALAPGAVGNDDNDDDNDRRYERAARVQQLKHVVQTIAEHELAAFPARVKGSNERPLKVGLDVICALASLAQDEPDSDNEEENGYAGDEAGNGKEETAVVAATLRNCFARILGPHGGIERWSWPLLVALELGKPVDLDIHGSSASGNTRGMERAWDLARIEGGLPGSLQIENGADALPQNGSVDPVVPFPDMRLRNVESREMNIRIACMFEAIGRAAGVAGLTTVDHLMGVAQRIKRRRNGGPVADAAVASSALWLVGRVVDGLAAGYEPAVAESVSRGVDEPKRVRKAARKIIDLIVQFDEDEEEFSNANATANDDEQNPTASGETAVIVEQRKGLGTISKLLDDSKRTPTRATEQAQALHAAMHRELVVCLNLRLLATCAKILSTLFKRHLISTLYLILSHLGSPHALVRRHAEISLGHIAYHTGYASPRNLILDNVDYVINIVSQRMTYKRLDPLAPMVLISMIKLVGEPIVPLVQDIIADIFDALDDFHGYTLLSSTILAVMDTLMKAMANEVQYAEYKPKRSTSARMRPGPEPMADFAKFTAWYEERASKARQTVDEMLDKAPKEPWGQAAGSKNEDPTEAPDNTSAEQEIPPTRSQEVCIQMMQKSIYFLTHANSFLTARVLSLFASGVPVLVTQERESDVLPLIHSAWPYVLNRLKDESSPYVRREAAALIESLAKWTGDFMSRRILDDAWPIFRDLLATQKRHDDQSALARRGGTRGTTSPYTVSHRLYVSMIQAMTYIVQEVPIADDLFWEIVVAFQPFLDSRVHEELGAAAVKLYRCMAERDQDAVWLALHSTMGTVVAGQCLPVYLREPGLGISVRAGLVV
ncbi:hypothetical protein QFC21_001711 [Naganishia friedmannii]|uniref:Uncharacterized protein n=1 Tax=Naganishia friedmannii TaxID=89922 RepID=A0ACC2W2L7_9TREE|nr:hypothetical protein QFC21_001711 [Naganishia friedmannii]